MKKNIGKLDSQNQKSAPNLTHLSKEISTNNYTSHRGYQQNLLATSTISLMQTRNIQNKDIKSDNKTLRKDIQSPKQLQHSQMKIKSEINDDINKLSVQINHEDDSFLLDEDQFIQICQNPKENIYIKSMPDLPRHRSSQQDIKKELEYYLPLQEFLQNIKQLKHSLLNCQIHAQRSLDIICVDCCEISCDYCIIFNKKHKERENFEQKSSSKNNNEKASCISHKYVKLQEFINELRAIYLIYNKIKYQQYHIKKSEQKQQKQIQREIKTIQQQTVISNLSGSYKNNEIIQAQFLKQKELIHQKIQQQIGLLRKYEKKAIQDLEQAYNNIQQNLNSLTIQEKETNPNQLPDKIRFEQCEHVLNEIEELSRILQDKAKQETETTFTQSLNKILKLVYAVDNPQNNNLKNKLSQINDCLQTTKSNISIEAYNQQHDRNSLKEQNGYIKCIFNEQLSYHISNYIKIQPKSPRNIQSSLQSFIKTNKNMCKSYVYETPIKNNKEQQECKNEQEQNHYCDNSFIHEFKQSYHSKNKNQVSLQNQTYDSKIINKSEDENQANSSKINSTKKIQKYHNQFQKPLLTQKKIKDSLNHEPNKIQNKNNEAKQTKIKQLIKNKSLDNFNISTNTKQVTTSKNINQYRSPSKNMNINMTAQKVEKSPENLDKLLKTQVKKNPNTHTQQTKISNISRVSTVSLQNFLDSSTLKSLHKQSISQEQSRQEQINKIIQKFIQSNPTSNSQLTQNLSPSKTLKSPSSRQTTQRQILDLSKFSLNDQQISSTLNKIYIQKKKRIKYLKLSYNQLTDTGFSNIIQYLSSASNVNISNNLLTSHVLDLIIKNRDRLAPLRIINLGGNIIKQEDKKVACKIESLKKMGILVNL